MVDKIILSTDETFRNFIPIASLAWRKFFPSIDVEIAFVTNRRSGDPIFDKIRKYANLTVYEPVSGIPTANQAKVARHILASTKEEKVCSIEDIDTIPLQSEYFQKCFDARPPSSVLAVGAEVFEGTADEGKFPMSTITAEGNTFKQFINPKELEFSEIIKSFVDIREFDKKEDISKHSFSDESLMRCLLSRWRDNNIHHITRDVDIREDWIDRSWWSIDSEKLYKGKYVTCNFMRPYESHMHASGDIIKYIVPGIPPRDLILE